jgi:large subunit ribosomal protein L22
MATLNLPAHPLPTHRKPGLEGAVNADRALGLPNAARAFQRTTRQSPYKVRLVIDQIRGQERQRGARAAEVQQEARGRRDREGALERRGERRGRGAPRNGAVDVDRLYVAHADRERGAEAQALHARRDGPRDPVHKRTSHIEIVVAEREGR